MSCIARHTFGRRVPPPDRRSFQKPQRLLVQSMVSIEKSPRQPSQGRLLRIVVTFAVCLIAISTLSLLYIGHIASNIADAQADDTERHLFGNVLKSRQMQMARDTYSLAHWDDAVQGIAVKFSRNFIRDTFVYSLAHDYGQPRSFLIDPDGRMVMSAVEDRVDFTRRDLPADGDFAVLTRKAVETHMRYRIPVGAGFSQKAVKSGHVGDISVSAFALVDGAPAIVTAMAVVPSDENVVMPKGNPYILISARPLDGSLLGELNLQLSYRHLAFRNGGSGKVPAVSISGTPLGSVFWESARPGARIWTIVVPVIVGLSLLLALACLVVMRHVGRLSALLVASEIRIRHFAFHDPLSGLPNRLQFDEALLDAATSRQPLAAIAGDLDRFKAVNDTHGHAAGDQVIKVVAERLRQTVGGHGMVGRTGGDEFVVLVRGFNDRARLSLLASQIAISVGLPITLESGAIVDVDISLGISIAPDRDRSPKEIMRLADQALYVSKTGGQGRVTFADDIEAAGAGEWPKGSIA